MELIESYLSNRFQAVLYNNLLISLAKEAEEKDETLFITNRLKLNNDKSQQMVLTTNTWKKTKMWGDLVMFWTHLVESYQATMPKTV